MELRILKNISNDDLEFFTKFLEKNLHLKEVIIEYEKISYLRGLADGLDVKADTKEGKLFYALMDVIEEIADAMTDIVEDQDEVNEYLDLLDEDLSVVEEEIFGDLELDEDDDY